MKKVFIVIFATIISREMKYILEVMPEKLPLFYIYDENSNISQMNKFKI